MVRWGILSTARIGREKVIPALQKAKNLEVAAIASRNEENARKVAAELGIEKAYGSYEALLADPDIDVIYNPLPNHMHVPMTIEAVKAGKHVLCEKPIALDAEEARLLLDMLMIALLWKPLWCGHIRSGSGLWRLWSRVSWAHCRVFRRSLATTIRTRRTFAIKLSLAAVV